MNRDFLAKAGKVVLFLVIVLVVLTVFGALVRGNYARQSLSQPAERERGAIGGMMNNTPRPTQGLADVASKGSMMFATPSNVGQSAVLDVPDMATSSDSQTIDQKIIKTGTLTLRVDDIDWSVGEITRIVSVAGGSVASTNILAGEGGVPVPYRAMMIRDDLDETAQTVQSATPGPKAGTVTVRVPASKFDETFSQLKRFGGTVTSESISGQDVTEQVVDMEARLKNKQAEEEAYANILKTQATKVSDVLEVTRALNQVRGEIESIQSQLKYLNSQADLSTITISLSENPKLGQTDTAWRPWQVVKASVNILLLSLQGLVDVLIRLVIVVLPVLLIVFGILGVIVWKIGKRIVRGLKGE